MAKMAETPGTKAAARRGPRGSPGKKGAPGVAPKDLHAIIADIEEVQKEAAIQFQRIAQLQAQLDTTLKALKEMGEKASHQRKRPKR
jgi:hypothetical protein